MKNVFKTLDGAVAYIKDIQDIGATDITLKVSGDDHIVNFAMSTGTLTKAFSDRKMLNGFPYNKTSPKPRLGYFR